MRLGCLALTLAFLTGCGPLQSSAFLADTEVMLAAAKTAQADRLAPYEWTSANLYFAKAKEEVGYADFETAIDYSKKAVNFATQARDSATKAAKNRGLSGAPNPAPPPPPPPDSVER